MRIACPSCEAAYDVPPDRLLPGRSVRCAKCGKVWEPVAREDATPPVPFKEAAPADAPQAPVPEALPDAPVPAPAPPAAPDPVAPEVPESAAVPTLMPAGPVQASRRGSGVIVLAWVASFALLGAAGYMAVTYRAALMQAWPPSIRAYAVLGLVRQ